MTIAYIYSLLQSKPLNVITVNYFFYFLFGVYHLATFIFNFLKRKSSHLSSIWCWGLNPRPLGHELSALTPRQLLLTLSGICTLMDLLPCLCTELKLFKYQDTIEIMLLFRLEPFGNYSR